MIYPEGSTTSDRLEYLFMHVNAARGLLIQDKNMKGISPSLAMNLDNLRLMYIAGLEGAVLAGLPEDRGIKLTDLKGLADLARSSNWTRLDPIKTLYRRTYELLELPYDEHELFPQK